MNRLLVAFASLFFQAAVPVLAPVNRSQRRGLV
jgi:hypothetical protein